MRMKDWENFPEIVGQLLQEWGEPLSLTLSPRLCTIRAMPFQVPALLSQENT